MNYDTLYTMISHISSYYVFDTLTIHFVFILTSRLECIFYTPRNRPLPPVYNKIRHGRYLCFQTSSVNISRKRFWEHIHLTSDPNRFLIRSYAIYTYCVCMYTKYSTYMWKIIILRHDILASEQSRRIFQFRVK